MNAILPAGLLWLLLINSAQADQSDPRLNDLFQTMANAPTQQISAHAERQIWRIWLNHSDDDVQSRFNESVRAMDRDPELALGLLNQLAVDAPDFAEVWNKRATLYYLLGNYEASLADIQRTLALEPRHFGALSGLGMIYMARGEHDLALGAFEAVLMLQPRSQVTLDNIRLLDAVLGRTST